MEERWIVVAAYSRLPEANQDADTLKDHDIDCKITLTHPNRAASIYDGPEKWILLEVLEDDFEDAAEILELEPSTLDDLEDLFENSQEEEGNRRGLYFWGGIFSLIIIARLLSEFWA